MVEVTHAELLTAMDRVLTNYIEVEGWNFGRSISELRQGLKEFHHRYSSDPAVMVSPTMSSVGEALRNLDAEEWDQLVDELDLETKFPSAPR